MNSICHAGERKIHAEAGVIEAAANFERIVLPVIAHLYVDFIQSQQYVFIGAADNRQ